MPTTHTWKTGAYGFLYDPTEYTDGTAFVPGDTLVFSSGTPDAANGTLATGTYQANTTGASVGLHLVNVTENSSTIISVAGPLILQWMALGIFVNNGTLSLGAPSSSGSGYYSLYDNVGSDGSFTNNGTMTLQNASRFTFDKGLSGNGNFVNTAGALLSVSSGSAFYGTGSGTIAARPVFENEGRVELNGAARRITSFEPSALYGGAGVLAVKGAAGDTPSDTIATFSGSASGRMDLSSGELLFNSSFDAGPNVTINFLDNDGLVFNAESETGGIIGTLRSGHPLQATINGFVAGDAIDYQLASPLQVPAVTLAYDTASHVLTVAMYAGEVSHLTLNGTYTLNDFHITQTHGLYTTIALTTTSTSNAITSAPGGGPPPPPSPDPLVDNAYYLAHNPDVAAAGIDPYTHYMAYGAQEGRNPDAWFDTSYYLAQNPDVKAAGVNPLAQFEAYGWKEGRDPSLLFSDAKYLAANPDVAAAKIDPLLHFLTNGQAEGRMAFLSGGTATADPLVNAAYYDPQLGATIIPTGAAAAQQAAFSYDAAGWQRHLNPDAYFDTGYYLAHNSDVAAAHIDPLAHYEAYGWKAATRRRRSARASTGGQRRRGGRARRPAAALRRQRPGGGAGGVPRLGAGTKR